MCATVVPASYVHGVPTPKLNYGGSEPLVEEYLIWL